MVQRLPIKKQILEAKIRYYMILAHRMKVEGGYLWLYHNGSAHRVPAPIRDKIAEYEEENIIRNPPWEKESNI